MKAIRALMPDAQSLDAYLTGAINAWASENAAQALPLVRHGDQPDYRALMLTSVIGTPPCDAQLGARQEDRSVLRKPLSLQQTCSQADLLTRVLRTLVLKQAKGHSQQRLPQPKHLLSLGYRQQRFGTNLSQVFSFFL